MIQACRYAKFAPHREEVARRFLGVCLWLAVVGCQGQAVPVTVPQQTPAPNVAATPPVAHTASSDAPPASTDKPESIAAPEKVQPPGEPAWKSLFDGKSLGAWKVTDFGGQGEVKVNDGQIELEMGNDLTGVTWSGELPRVDYEISLEAKRVDGTDFFCGLTFPVKEFPCSLIVGGWGGSVVGLSSLNGQDASANETTDSMTFEKGRWYRIRVRVTADKIEAWIDDDQVADVTTADHEISIRPEVRLSEPLGICTWRTTGALRDLKLRRLPAQAAPAAPVSPKG